MKRKSKPAQRYSQLRIIGGKWRGSKVYFKDAPHLRPTTDRIRETLFNWLAPHIEGARCLDCFAGSGALGFEAASRGAKEVLMIDQGREVITTLNENIERLKFDNIETVCNVLPGVMVKEGPFDIVFLDPPFRQNLLEPTVVWLLENGLLAKEALVYIESEKELLLTVPETWRLHRSKTAGKVLYSLYLA